MNLNSDNSQENIFDNSKENNRKKKKALLKKILKN